MVYVGIEIYKVAKLEEIFVERIYTLLAKVCVMVCIYFVARVEKKGWKRGQGEKKKSFTSNPGVCGLIKGFAWKLRPILLLCRVFLSLPLPVFGFLYLLARQYLPCFFFFFFLSFPRRFLDASVRVCLSTIFLCIYTYFFFFSSIRLRCNSMRCFAQASSNLFSK